MLTTQFAPQEQSLPPTGATSHMRQSPTLITIPKEILVIILSMNVEENISELPVLKSVCQRFKVLLDSEEFWKMLFQHKFPKEEKIESQSWISAYKMNVEFEKVKKMNEEVTRDYKPSQNTSRYQDTSRYQEAFVTRYRGDSFVEPRVVLDQLERELSEQARKTPFTGSLEGVD